jgi:hypothetical protein
MKVFVTHDHEGRIRSLALQAPGARGQLGVAASRGDVVSEVEVKIAGDSRDGERVGRQLLAIAEGFRVAGAPGKPRLAKIQ